MNMDRHELMEGKRRMFDAYCKKILRNEARDIYARQRSQARRETMFSEMNPAYLGCLAANDEYFGFEDVVNVRGLDFVVCDEELYHALLQLPALRQEIVLLFYFLRWTDRRIGLELGMTRANVQYHRSCALRQLREIIEYERRS